MKVRICDIGPAEADELLASQGSGENRRMRPNHVRWLAGAMARGEWRENGEAIKLDKYGRLRDGQHRLQAVKDSGVTVRMVVVEGLEPSAQETMDTGAHRTMSDVLALRGERNTALLAATLGMLHRIRTDAVQAQPGALRPTPHQLVALLEEEPDIRDFLQKGRRVSDRIHITASLAAAYWYVFSRIDRADADDFFTRLIDGLELQAGDPIAALRRFLEREHQGARKLPRYRIAGVLVKAWNFYRQGVTEVQTLGFRAGGANPERFPAVDGMPETALPQKRSRPKAKSGRRRIADENESAAGVGSAGAGANGRSPLQAAQERQSRPVAVA